jgi:hypothetical protein
MWNDAKVRRLSAPQPCGQSLWVRLLTGPELTNVPGLIPVGEAALAEALEWPVEAFRKAFGEVSREGLAKADWEARLVWVPKAIHHNQPQSPNVVSSWGTAWDEAPECELKAEAYRELESYCKAKGKAFLEAFRKACGKPSPNQEQEQEQEQKQESVYARDPAAVSPEALNAAYLDGWKQRHPKVKPHKRANLMDPLWQRVAESLDGPEAMARLLEAFWADDFCQRTGFKPGALESEATKLLAHGPSKPKARGPTRPSQHHEFADDDPDAVWGREAAV